MKFLDRDHPFFARPLTRWITTLLPITWGCVEFWFASPGWGMMFLAAGLWAGYEFFIRK